jgi:hypothetical protein
MAKSIATDHSQPQKMSGCIDKANSHGFEIWWQRHSRITRFGFYCALRPGRDLVEHLKVSDCEFARTIMKFDEPIHSTRSTSNVNDEMIMNKRQLFPCWTAVDKEMKSTSILLHEVILLMKQETSGFAEYPDCSNSAISSKHHFAE